MNCPEYGEKFILDRQQKERFFEQCRDIPQISDCLILNTCNRLEFYFYARKNFDAAEMINVFFNSEETRLLRHPASLKLRRTPRNDTSLCWEQNMEEFKGIEVPGHLFRVAAGLESQIIGENEIFAQLKSAYSFAIECNMIKAAFHHLFHCAFRVAKAVRTETEISSGALSIAGAAVVLAQINCEIEKAKVFVVGSGANAEVLLKHLIKKKVRDITVVGRNQNSTMELIKKTKGKFVQLENLGEKISDADVVFTATSAKEPLITAEMVKNRINPLVMIDLSVPSNIEREQKNSNVKIFNIQSLDEIIKSNNLKRKNEIPKVQAVINEHLPVVSEWFENKKAVQMVH
ncbi:MAG: glutamyl-tRNA reductase [Phycisphaerales bacterium]